MHNSGPWLVRRARQLILDVARGDTEQHIDALVDLARTNPRRLAELTVEVAFLAGEHGSLAALLGDIEPADDELRDLVAREAHRLHWYGFRHAWVVWGERMYQRTVRARRRARQKAPAA